MNPPDRFLTAHGAMSNVEQLFQVAIGNAGLTPPDQIIGDGKIHRFSSNGKRGDDAGWYVLYLDGVPGGSFGCWRAGLNLTWSEKPERAMTQDERKVQHQRTERAQAQRDTEKAAAQAAAAIEASRRWEAAEPAKAHGYLTAKGVAGYGLRIDAAGVLLVPMRDAAGKLQSLQTISEDGEDKRYLFGGKVSGCYHSIGKPKGTLIVCEGYATGASLHSSTRHAVAVAFSAGNLEAVALALRAKYPELTIIIAADDDFQTAGNPGMTKAKSAAKAAGAMLAVPDFGADRPDKATDFNDLHQIVGAAAVRRCIETAGNLDNGASHDPRPESSPLSGTLLAEKGFDTEKVIAEATTTWPQPTAIKSDLPPPPAFDGPKLLPKTLCDFVLDEADRMPCSPDYVAAALIVSLGAVIGARCAIRPKRLDDWIVTPNLFGGVVGDPSTKKTPGINAALRFLDRLEAKEAEKHAGRMKVHEAEMAAFSARQLAIQGAMKKAAAGKGDGPKMDSAVADLQSLQPPVEPCQRRFKTNDGTVAKIGDILVSSPAGLMVFRDELIGLLSSWDRVGNEGDLAFYLEGFNGTGSFNIDRVGRGCLFIKTMCLSVFGGIQPELLERYLSDIINSLDNDGRIQRFQVLVYPEPVVWAWRDRYPIKGAREAVRDLFDRLADFEPVQDGAKPADDFVKLPYFSFDDKAQEIFIKWATNLYLNHISVEQNPLMRQHLAKFEKLFCSLALILHLAEGRVGPVRDDSATRAAAWCGYLEGHARRIYAMSEVAKVSIARRLSQHLITRKLPDDGFTTRDVVRKNWSGLGNSLQAEAALAVLEEHGWVVSADTLEKAVGRPTTRYYINPLIYGSKKP